MILVLMVIFAIIGIFIHKRVRRMSILRRNGIPGPKPNLIFGNLFVARNLSSIERQKAWIEKYGKIVGCYSGAKPVILVADPDLAKNIQIKDFQYFTDRPHMSMKFIYPNPRQNGSLIKVSGKRWKEIRSILTPTFSASKLKTMTPIIDNTIQIFIDIVDNYSASGEEFNIFELFQSLTTDVITRTSFAVKTDVQTNIDNKFLKAVKNIMNNKLNKWLYFIYLTITCFPELEPLLLPIRRIDEMIRHRMGRSPNGVLLDMSSDIIKLRKENPNPLRNDLLQTMLDLSSSSEQLSAMSDESLTASKDENENYIYLNNDGSNGVKNSAKFKNNIHLTEDEIRANCVVFFEAGYETTSTTLGFVAHILVNYPEVQERVREEVRELYESEGKLDFNTVNRLEYMECVLNETMRLYPPVITFVSRESLTDYKYNDMTIPKGATVAMATYYLHHDPDYWEEPEKFDPDRFSAERKAKIHSSSWQPFGSGPRNCIGMRFALFEAKLCLAKLLLNYRLESGEKTEIGDLSIKCKLISMAPKNGIFVRAVRLKNM